MMILLTILCVVILKNAVMGLDVNSAIPRTNCYKKEQPGCDTDFIDEYPSLSKSATSLTDADTYFWLFTRRNQDEPENLHRCAGRLPPNSNFNANNRLIVILTPFIAGFCDVAIYREWLAQFLEREDCNVLVVDYSWGQHLDYGTAVLNIPIVANQTAIVLRNIQNDTGIEKEQFYMVGHSLGAQLAGLIGQLFPVYRITGVDPAGPGFSKETPLEDKLDRSDADLVDIWHCNMGCLPNLGTNYDHGTVDFYINGGTYQPSCHKYAFQSLLKKDFLYGIGTLLSSNTCWHAQCAQFYKVAINPGDCQFIGVECSNCTHYKSKRRLNCGSDGSKCTIMGYDWEKCYTKTGTFPQRYHVETSLECPYCDNSNIRLQGFSGTCT